MADQWTYAINAAAAAAAVTPPTMDALPRRRYAAANYVTDANQWTVRDVRRRRRRLTPINRRQ